MLSTDEEPATDDPTPGNLPSDEQIKLRRIARERKPNKRHPNNVNISFQFAFLVSDLCYYEAAAKQSKWKNAMVEEMQAIERYSTWEFVDFKEERNVIELKWVFLNKVQWRW